MHIALLAGEESGDHLGAELILSLRKINPAIRFDGVGGKRMTDLGFHSLIPISSLSVMGFTEVAKALPRLIRYRNFLYEHYQSSMPDAFVAIDFPDFNLGLEAKLKRIGIHTIHYVSPSVWAWREGRVNKIRNSCDLMLTLFDFEKEFYDEHNVPAVFCGHPLADSIRRDLHEVDSFKSLGLIKDKSIKRLALLPGSRKSEIEKLMPIFLEIGNRLLKSYPNLQFIVPAATKDLKDLIDTEIRKNNLKNLAVTLGKSREAMVVSDAVLLSSGTATLEAALLGKPMVVAYKVSNLTALIGKLLIKASNFSLPNIIADGKIVPEYIQDEIDIETMVNNLESLLYDDTARKRMKDDLKKVKDRVKPGGSDRAAKAVYQAIIQSGLY